MGLEPNILQQLNEIGIALSKEHRIPILHEMILQNAKELTRADGGTIYTVVDNKQLHFEIVISDSLNFHLGGSSSNPIPFADLPLFLEDGSPNDSLMVAYAVNHKKTIKIKDAYDEEGFDFSGTVRFDAHTGYRTKAVLTIPMKNHEDEVIAVLQLINPIEPRSGEVDEFTDNDVQLAQSLASQAGIALNNRLLIQNLRKLFESLIHVIAEAIDEKSPSTGNHGKRVPILATLLAHAEGSLTDQQMYELEIASYLHDCGKITTPEYIIEKKTKLQTIYDRIETVDARFDCAKLKASSEEKKRELDEDRAFAHRCNEGKEPITPEAMERINRLTGEGILTRDEQENLLISKGNLTEKERKIIEHHVVMTYRMLSQLPFPKGLRAVADIAASHHERMDGKGYPRGLKKEEMLIQSRILMIADVFESLSAPDRPYRKPAPLSQVFKIMQQMCDEGHLDPDLFAIFLKKKAYIPYANRYLMPEQLDVD